MAKKKQPGRPRGARTAPRVEVVSRIAQCPSCASTHLTDCTQTNTTEHAGERDGKPYTHIVRRWKRCADCGQAVIERTYECRPAGGQETDKEPDNVE